jgi:hypothetical protein
MYIEFNVCKLKPESKSLKQLSNLPYTKVTIDTKFIVVGEEPFKDMNFVKLVPIENNLLTLIDGLSLDEVGYGVNEEDIYFTQESQEFDVPNKYLTIQMVEEIQKINERL